MNKLLFIINPKAGNGDITKAIEDIELIAKEKNVEYDTYYTNARYDGCDQVKKRIAQGYRKFVVMGGDGTLNEVVNGIFQQNQVPPSEIAIGLISKGTGNDWGRYYNYKGDHKENFLNILNNGTIKQDIGRIEYSNNGKREIAYFINIAGFGFDAEVAHATNKLHLRGRRRKSAYMYSLLKCLVKSKPFNVKLTSENETLEAKVFSISVGNGKFSGGGMEQTPNAIINDGMLDITVYEDITKFQVVKNVKRLYNSSIYEIKQVIPFRGNKFTLECDEYIFCETDGEIIGNGPYEISIIPNVLNVMGLTLPEK